MGKYTEIVKGLPILRPEEGYQDKIRALIAEHQSPLDENGEPREIPWVTSGELAARYKELRAEKKEDEQQLSDTNLELEAITQMLAARYEEEGLSSVKFAEGGSVSIQPEPYATVEDKDTFHEWCMSEGYKHQMQLSWQTTNALTKKRLIDGLEAPPGVKVFVKQKTVLRS